MDRPGRGQNRGRGRREGGAGGEVERREQSGCPESLHPQSDPPFPPPLSPAHPHPSPSTLWPSLQISSTPALLLTVPRTFPSPDPGLCLLQRHPPHPHPSRHTHPSRTLCFAAFPPPTTSFPPTWLTCNSVMDMISCQVSSISPGSGMGSCVTLFLLCCGGHGDILLGQGLLQGRESPDSPSNLCQRRNKG